MKKKSARDIPDFSRQATHSEGKPSPRTTGKQDPGKAPAPQSSPKASSKSPNAGRRGQ
jgi:hypothetical protein